jgi:hypothetical protein
MRRTRLIAAATLSRLAAPRPPVRGDRARREHELSRLDALREAKLYVLHHPEVIRGADPPKDDARLRPTPRYWAAFTLSGDRR